MKGFTMDERTAERILREAVAQGEIADARDVLLEKLERLQGIAEEYACPCCTAECVL